MAFFDIKKLENIEHAIVISADQCEALRIMYWEWCSARSCGKCEYNGGKRCLAYKRHPSDCVDFLASWAKDRGLI